jgi:hypothetical protein
MTHNDMHRNSHAVGSQQMSSRREIQITNNNKMVFNNNMGHGT